MHNEGNEKIITYLTVGASSFEKELGFGSAVPIVVEVENPYDYYLPLTVYVSTLSIGVNLTENNVKRVVLEPGDRKNLYWIVKVPHNLDPDLIYTGFIKFNNHNITFGN